MRVPAAARRILDSARGSGALWTAALVLERALRLNLLGLWPETRVPADALSAQVRAVLHAWGMPEPQASITSGHVLYADLHGIDSHGCAMLLHYHRKLVAGSLSMAAPVEVVRETATTALVDGGGGLGHVPADTAMRLAIAKCREAGLGAVAVRNSGHYGAAGSYAAMAAAAGLIGVATTNSDVPAVVPTFGLDARLGTNPIAVAAPAARNPPFLLDMATSTVPVGKLLAAWRSGRAVPEGWALDPHGRPVANGRVAARHRRLTPLGSSPPMGSHKGYGLAAAVEILSSVLPGLRSGPGAGAPRVGHFFLALDPRRFGEDGDFEAGLDELIDSLHATRPLDPERPVLVAGDPEHAARAERSSSGIPLSRSVLEDLRAVCRASGVPFVLDEGG